MILENNGFPNSFQADDYSCRYTIATEDGLNIASTLKLCIPT